MTDAGAPDAASAARPAWARHLEPGIDPRTVDLLAAGSLPRAWVRGWEAAPDHRVLRDLDGSWSTAGDLAERSQQVARRLLARGLVPGDRVLLGGPASVDYVVAHVAVLRAGLVAVPVNPACARRELDGIVADARPGAAILGGEQQRDWVVGADRAVVVTDVDVDLPEGPAAPLDQTGPADPALLPYTSGTTGIPKGVPLSHGNLLASAEAVRLAWRWRSTDRLILCLPLFHMHGMGVGLHGTLLAGASAVLHPGFDPEAVLRDASTGATLFFGVPTMYSRLAVADGAERLGALRLCVSGSAPLSAELHGRIAARCGQAVLERYGMTETVMLVSNPYDGERRPGTVGFPLPGVDIRLDDTTDEILVRGPNVFSGYLDRPEANAVSFTDGWFRTGDIGRIDTDGYLRIVGRAKELIISGGYNVYPREVEDVLRSHPSVVDAVVVGTPSAEWGEIVTAYVEAGEDFDHEAVLAWVTEQVTHYKRPRIVHRVEALPRNSLGKVVRHELTPPE